MHVLDDPWSVKENISPCASNKDLLWQTNFLLLQSFAKKLFKTDLKFSVAKNEKIYNKNHHVPIFGFNV
jgi:hypothetical protein